MRNTTMDQQKYQQILQDNKFQVEVPAQLMEMLAATMNSASPATTPTNPTRPNAFPNLTLTQQMLIAQHFAALQQQPQPQPLVAPLLATSQILPMIFNPEMLKTPPAIPPAQRSPFSINSILSPQTPSPVEVSSRIVSPSNSNSSKNTEEKEEEDDDEFVDVESVDSIIDSKDRRKAHVEFYRKMKAMRQREKILTCSMCKSKVENVENTIQTHVNSHADAGEYQCRVCGWQSNDKYRIYDHMRKEHPKRVEMFVDKRDMQKMCSMVTQCFPKASCRPKKESNKGSELYLSTILESTSFKSKCRMCNSPVQKDRNSVIRHVQACHVFKCKTCKVISFSLDEQLTHQKDVHKQEAPKMSVHFAPSAAANFLQPALERCFPL